MRKGVSFLPGFAVAIFNMGWDMIGYQNSKLGFALWTVAGTLILIPAVYWTVRRLRGYGELTVERGLGVSDRQNSERSGRYVDNRSQSMSNSPGGQQAFGDIINQGPQPRDISEPAGNELVAELQKRVVA
jgi:hypothetical protein